ncbi:MAG: phosphodiester glycosidase family protein [Acidobacteriota bacterium]|nr:phosphodiester glycosidase family protein [Acidobacteriota bacterium]
MDLARPVYRPPAPPRQNRLPAHVYWRRRAIVLLAAVTITFAGYLGVTLAFALHNPSYGVSMQARAAEWGRQHGLGSFVTWVETEWYKLHPAKIGGTVSPKSFGSGPTTVKIPQGVYHLPAPANIVSPVAHPLPGEGVWHVVGRRTANGVPTVYEAFIRPDPIHTSYIVGIAWMDPTLLRAQLYSGSFIPGTGGPFRFTAPISAPASRTLVAAFNAGFRMQDANGGYYTQGKTILPLRNGAASVVVFKDGTMTVAKWGRDATMSDQIASVRQNLDLIVDHGQAVPGLAAQNSIKWGKTLGGTFNVWRSGLGVTRSGALVYVGGPALSISDLANVLVRAGAVRAMELDINTDWVQYSIYNGPLNAAVNGGNGTDLLNTLNGSPSRFFATWWNRDFFTMSLRSGTTGATTTTTTTPLG